MQKQQDMANEDEAILESLLDRWEDAFEQGIDLKTEALCHDVPDLRIALEAKIHALKNMDQNLSIASTLSEQNELASTNQRISELKNFETRSRFERIAYHARGTAGEVYRAVDVSLARTVAIKVLRLERVTAWERSQFQWESEVTSRLDHPAIIPVYSGGVLDDGRPFYVMRFVQGTSLEQSIHEFHNKTARRLYRSYAQTESFLAVASGIAQGVIALNDVPEEVREQVQQIAERINHEA